MKILVTGAAGLLGTDVVATAGRREHTVLALDREALDVTDEAAVTARVASEAPDWVFHCAAYTAVDAAEDEPELAMRVNRDGAENVARAASAAGARMLYVSTDYVFNGEQRSPYRPTDPTGPLSVYGRTKLAGEEAVLGADADGGSALIVRTGWLYGAAGRSFVTAILERATKGDPLSVVADQRGRPTWTRNVAEVALDLLESDASGIWHVADGGDATWLGFAREILRLRGLKAPIRGVFSEQWGAAAPRPAYSVMNVSATEERIGRPMMDWKVALERFLDEEMGGLVAAGG
jgi:dTDP-4-dehydrorhamnose reductase/4-ketoreductase